MKVESIDQIWTEKQLAGRFEVPFKEETGRSRVISGWINKGLRCAVRISEKRYFFESDVIAFFNQQAENECQSHKEFDLNGSSKDLQHSLG